MDLALQANGLAKQFRIGRRSEYVTVRDAIAHAAGAPLRALRRVARRGPASQARDDTFWALRDVSFDVRRGEVVGIIGHNGAGKSTLLKVLSRISEPTLGYVDVFGTVGSLLEVGTGFHPELTGRENIFLNGAILGMPRSRIREKFDEIVAFAEVDRFIDTPVKHYSSGMYLRLAFAVAAHLDPEILVIDEVLAVGDAQFQKKCFSKMREVSGSGRTILFVSHNLSAVRTICSRAIVLERGRLIENGQVDVVVDRYLARGAEGEEAGSAPAETSRFRVDSVRIASSEGPVIRTFDRVEVRVRVTAKVDVADPGLYVAILTPDQFRLAAVDYKDFATVPPLARGESVELAIVIESLPTLPGSYQLELYVKDMAIHAVEQVPRAYPFEVVDSAVYGGRRLDQWFGAFALRAGVAPAEQG